MSGRVQRLVKADGRAPVVFWFDGARLQGLDGDTVLTAVLAHRPSLRADEFGPGTRAGFCLMGACQDCWLWQEHGPRLRACSTILQEGMRLRSSAPQGWPA
jgi:hypothetical protein